ncbi:MAG: hypothetical protein ISS78_00805 [Phycisphaerae bacterium]|nr:hypothetical protein [Phycisphaerae bacterium]
MRAFRPSYFATDEDLDEDGVRAKQENVSLYEILAKLGRPLFDLAHGTEHREVQKKAPAHRR